MTGKEYGIMFLLNLITAILLDGIVIGGILFKLMSVGANVHRMNGSPPPNTFTAYQSTENPYQ